METNIINAYIESKSGRSYSDSLQGIKDLLACENRGIRLAYVEESTGISLEEVPLDKIFVPNESYYRKVEPRTIPMISNVRIAGVLYWDGAVYQLIDGYHRMKFLKETLELSGTYIILFR